MALLRPTKRPPSERLAQVAVSWPPFRLINLGESPKAIRRKSLIAQVNRPLRGCYRIALLSLKGGVGKTTITATLGATFASLRGDRVVAVDANPDRGTLSQKVPLETPATVRHLLRDAEGIEQLQRRPPLHVAGPSRLEVLASESDPAVSEAFSSDDYTRTLEVLERFYSLVLTDCGTGLMHSAMSAVLDKADVLIVISSGSVDGARSASATLDWLDAHGHQDLVRNSIAVINAVRPAVGQGRHAEGRRPLLAPLPRGACWSRSTRIWRRAPRSSLDRLQAGDPGGADRAGGGGRRRVSRRRASVIRASARVVVSVAEPPQEFRVVVGSDDPGLRAVALRADQPPAGIDQTRPDDVRSR